MDDDDDNDDDDEYEFGNSIDRNNIVATTIRLCYEEGGETQRGEKNR